MVVKIVADSTCDLPPAICRQLGITVVPLRVHLGDHTFLDGVDVPQEVFRRWLREGKAGVKTAAPNPVQFQTAYEALIAAGADAILSIHLDATLSATFQAAQLAAQQISSVPIVVFDARQLSLGTGFQVLAAAKAAQDGASLADLVQQLNQRQSQITVFAAVNDLSNLHRSGRIDRFQTRLGTWLQIKPVLHIHQGQIGLTRTRTFQRALHHIGAAAAKLQPLQDAVLLYTDQAEPAEMLRHHLQATHQIAVFSIQAVSPVISTHMGPGAVGLACLQGLS